MARPGFSQITNFNPNQAQLKQASNVVDYLVDGKFVEPEVIKQSTETLLESLCSNTLNVVKTAQSNLPQLIKSLTNANDQAEIIGALVAVGKPAQPILEQLSDLKQSLPVNNLLNKDEMKSLINCLPDTLQERLKAVIEMLQKEASENPLSKAIPLSSLLFPVAGVAIKNDLKEYLVENDSVMDIDIKHNKDTDPSPDKYDLTNNSIPMLVDMLYGNSNDKEFAAVALIHLGRTPEARNEVYDEMLRLEMEPEIESITNFIRQGIDASWKSIKALIPKGLYTSKKNTIGDGWLCRAIATCDSPNILKASAGREVIAMPLIIRQLVNVRSHHKQRLDSKS
jgi:hypothetical protein